MERLGDSARRGNARSAPDVGSARHQLRDLECDRPSQQRLAVEGVGIGGRQLARGDERERAVGHTGGVSARRSISTLAVSASPAVSVVVPITRPAASCTVTVHDSSGRKSCRPMACPGSVIEARPLWPLPQRSRESMALRSSTGDENRAERVAVATTRQSLGLFTSHLVRRHCAIVRGESGRVTNGSPSLRLRADLPSPARLAVGLGGTARTSQAPRRRSIIRSRSARAGRVDPLQR